MDYHLKPISKTCAATGASLEPGMKCHSVLVEQNGQLVRLDYAAENWSGPPEGTIGQWQSVVPQPEQNKTKPLDPEGLLRYFEQLHDDASPAMEKMLYIISLLLLQKRRLRIEGSRQDGETEILELVGSQGEGPFEVRDHHLNEEEIEQIQQELNTHLATEWSS